MKKVDKLIILTICLVIPIAGYSQKTIKRNTKPVKGNVGNSKRRTFEHSNKGKNREKKSSGNYSSSETFNKEALIEILLSNMVEVEGGTFSMGSESCDALTWEKPVHDETVESFRIGKFEVTQKEWLVLMDTNPSYFKNEDLPVQGISFEDCMNYIEKLKEISGLNFRLPTEAEWEYAARGGNQSKGFIYSGSDNIDDVAWFGDNCKGVIHRVGAKAPNELGLYDMSGNVWEWTSDKFCKNYILPRNGYEIVIRGGSWLQDKNDCKVSNRGYSNPSTDGLSYGFRLALDF